LAYRLENLKPPSKAERRSLHITTGVILVDRIAKLELMGLPALRCSYHMVDGKKFREPRSTRKLLTRCMKENGNLKRNLKRLGIPAPFVVLQDLYRVMCFEWIRMNSYITRDLNFIEWILQCGTGHDTGHDADRGHHKPKVYKRALRTLFHIRRRLNRYLPLIQEQLASCYEGWKPNWKLNLGKLSSTASQEPAYSQRTKAVEQQHVVDQVDAELVGDFNHGEALIRRNFYRLDQSIQHIAGEAAMRETEQTNQQGYILLVLAIAGFVFVLVGTIAAVLNMAGVWAPDKPNFDLFWAVCISISVVLMLMFFVVIYGRRIVRWCRRVRQRGKARRPASRRRV
jgi:hypothetical protein